MRNARLVRIYSMAALYSFAANMIHPITPTMITQLGQPDFMFGALFAAMALGSLFFSAPWGRMADKFGRRVVLMLSLLGYGIFQYLFGLATQTWSLLLTRFLSGCTTSGTAVAAMAMIVDASPERDRAGNLSVYAALTCVFGSFGYFGGGMLGAIVPLKVVFALHTGLLVCSAWLAWVLLPDIAADSAVKTRVKQPLDKTKLLSLLSVPALLFLASVALANFGSTGFDTAFNYYIKRELDFPSSANGIIKAVTGLLGLGANLFINRWIARRFEANRALTVMLTICSATLFGVTVMPNVPSFIAMNMAFYLFNAMYTPMQQALMARGGDSDYGLISGLFQTARSVGMISGALVAGFIYSAGPMLPFYTQLAAFAAAALTTFVSRRGREDACLDKGTSQGVE